MLSLNQLKKQIILPELLDLEDEDYVPGLVIGAKGSSLSRKVPFFGRTLSGRGWGVRVFRLGGIVLDRVTE